MPFHYQLIVSLYSCCSIIVASGPTGIKVGLNLFGSCNNNMFVKGTNRGSLEMSSMSAIYHMV